MSALTKPSDTAQSINGGKERTELKWSTAWEWPGPQVVRTMWSRRAKIPSRQERWSRSVIDATSTSPTPSGPARKLPDAGFLQQIYVPSRQLMSRMHDRHLDICVCSRTAMRETVDFALTSQLAAMTQNLTDSKLCAESYIFAPILRRNNTFPQEPLLTLKLTCLDGQEGPNPPPPRSTRKSISETPL